MTLPFVPTNIRETQPAAPDELNELPQSEALKDFRFPVFNYRVSFFLELAIIVAIVSLIALYLTQQAIFYAKFYAKDLGAIVFAPIVVFAFILLLNVEIFRSWTSRIFYLLSLTMLLIMTIALNYWLFHFALGLAALCYFLDCFLLHGTYMRSSCTNSFPPKMLNATVKSRFTLSDKTPINLLNYLFPLLALGLLSIYHRDLFETDLQNSRRTLAQGISIFISEFDNSAFNPIYSLAHLSFVSTSLACLVVLPVVADFFAPYFGEERFGLARLYREFSTAIHSWFFYNVAQSSNSAVLQSPIGTCRQRRLMFLGALAFVLPITLPTTLFQLQMDEIQDRRNKNEDFFMRPSASKLRLDLPNASVRGVQLVSTNFQLDSQDEFTSDVMKLTPLDDGSKKRAAEQRDLQDREQALQRLRNAHRRDALTEGLTDSPDRQLERLPLLIVWLLTPINPLLLTLCVLFAGAARPMAIMTDIGGAIPTKNKFASDTWPRIIDQLTRINRKFNRQELFFGLSANDQSPVIVPRSVLGEHAHFLGDTGSGKTSLGISPLLSQLINFADCSVVVLDLKADDQTLFELMRDEARKVSGVTRVDLDSREWSYPFSYFSVSNTKASHLFNPLTQPSFQSIDKMQQTDFLASALGLYYGTDYGRKYYSDANFNAIQKLLEPNDAISFHDLASKFNAMEYRRRDREAKIASSNAKFSFQRLAHITALNTKPDNPAAAIDIDNIFTKPQAIYFSLPAATGSTISSDVGRLILYSILNAAQAAPKPRRQVFVIIDEFQRLVAGNVEVVLQMARSLNVGIILSNQSQNDLNVNGINILSTVQTNTRLRQIFGVSDPEDIKRLVDISGEKTFFLRTFESLFQIFLPSLLQTATYQEKIASRLSVNDLLQATDSPGRSIFLLRRGEGTAQYRGLPFVMESAFHIPQALYKARQVSPWPKETQTAKIHSVPPPIPDIAFYEDALDLPNNPAQRQPISQVAPEVVHDFLNTLDEFGGKSL